MRATLRLDTSDAASGSGRRAGLLPCQQAAAAAVRSKHKAAGAAGTARRLTNAQQIKMGEPASAADACAEVALSVEQVAPMQGFKSFDGVDRKSTRFAVFPGNGEGPKASAASQPKASVASRASVSRASTRASKRHLGAALLGALHHGAGPSPDGFGNHLASASSSLPPPCHK